jgi:hypothetical protein
MPPDTSDLLVGKVDILTQHDNRLISMTRNNHIRIIDIFTGLNVDDVVIAFTKIVVHTHDIRTLRTLPLETELFGQLDETLSNGEGMVEKTTLIRAGIFSRGRSREKS